MVNIFIELFDILFPVKGNIAITDYEVFHDKGELNLEDELVGRMLFRTRI